MALRAFLANYTAARTIRAYALVLDRLAAWAGPDAAHASEDGTGSPMLMTYSGHRSIRGKRNATPTGAASNHLPARKNATSLIHPQGSMAGFRRILLAPRRLGA